MHGRNIENTFIIDEYFMYFKNLIRFYEVGTIAEELIILCDRKEIVLYVTKITYIYIYIYKPACILQAAFSIRRFRILMFV